MPDQFGMLILTSAMSVVATLVAASMSWGAKRLMDALKAEKMLEESAVRADIQNANLELKGMIDQTRAEFRELRAKVETSMVDLEKQTAEQYRRYERSIETMRNIIAKAEGRFSFFQEELKEIHVMCERLKKAVGAPRGGLNGG